MQRFNFSVVFLDITMQRVANTCSDGIPTRVRKTTVRTTPVRSQQCECQQCERVNSANANSANATAVRMSAVRMRQQCERRFSELRRLCKTYRSLSFFFFAKTFATFYLNFWPKNAHNNAVQHLPRDVKVGIHSFLCGETFHTKKTAKNCLKRFFSAKTFCIGEKNSGGKNDIHLKPQKTKVHLLKFYIYIMVNCFFLIFTRFAYQNDFFILAGSSHFTFGSDCTVCWSWHPDNSPKIRDRRNQFSPVLFSNPVVWQDSTMYQSLPIPFSPLELAHKFT